MLNPKYPGKPSATRSMRAVVVDEADQLLTGGYERDCTRVLDAFREGDRLRKAGAVCAELRISPEHFQELPRHFRRAAYEGASLDFVAGHSSRVHALQGQ